MAQKKKANLSREETVTRAKTAIEKARQRVGEVVVEDLSLKKLDWWRERWHIKEMRRKFLETNVKVRDALNENELVPFVFNDIQDDLWNNLTGKDVILKMRRGGLSTFFQAISIAETMMRHGLKARAVPHDTDTEMEFRETVKTIFENFNPGLKPPTKYYNEQRILFSHKSEYRTQIINPKREGKGRGLAIQLLHLTEVAFWIGNKRKALTTLLTAAEGGRIFVESTANGVEEFEGLYQDGKKGRAGWKSHFYQWWWRRSCRLAGAKIEPLGIGEIFYLVRPDERFSQLSGQRLENAKLTRREEAVAKSIYRHLIRRGYITPKGSWRDDWFRPEVAEYLAWRRSKIEDIGERDFKVEYPENDNECFENTGRTVISQTDAKVTCLPELPQEFAEYVVAADTSLGKPTSDPAAIEVLNLHTGRQAHSEELLLAPDLLAYRLQDLSDEYNGAIIAVENNNTGIATVNKLLELVEEERIFKELTKADLRAIKDGRMTYEEAMAGANFGIATTTANKGLMGVLIERAVRTKDIGLSNEEWCEQSKHVVWLNNNTWAAESGHHDDRFMALCIANFVRVQALAMSGSGFEILPEVGDAR